MTRWLCAAVLVLGLVAAQGVKCAIDKTGAYFTGKTKTDSATGKLLYEYHCARDHYFWIVK